MAQVLEVRVRNNRLPAMQQELPGLVLESAHQSALGIQQRAKSLAPVDTGALRDSISVEQGRDLAGRFTDEWVVYSPLDYSVFQEYGFHHWISGAFISPQPYMTPAAALEWPAYQARVIRALGQLK